MAGPIVEVLFSRLEVFWLLGVRWDVKGLEHEGSHLQRVETWR